MISTNDGIHGYAVISKRRMDDHSVVEALIVPARRVDEYRRDDPAYYLTVTSPLSLGEAGRLENHLLGIDPPTYSRYSLARAKASRPGERETRIVHAHRVGE